MSYKRKKKMSKKKKEFLSIVPGSPTGAEVVNGDLKYAIRKWKKRLKDSGTMRSVYENQEYTKPSTQRRKIKLDAIYKQRKISDQDDK